MYGLCSKTGRRGHQTPPPPVPLALSSPTATGEQSALATQISGDTTTPPNPHTAQSMQDVLMEEITSENPSVVSRGERLGIERSVKSVSKSN